MLKSLIRESRHVGEVANTLARMVEGTHCRRAVRTTAAAALATGQHSSEGANPFPGWMEGSTLWGWAVSPEFETWGRGGD